MAFYLGIDGGGSKTACVVGNETAVLGTGSSGGSNVVRVGEAQAWDSLQAAILQACQAAHVTPSEIQGACAGMAGAGRPEVRDVVHRLLARVVPSNILVVGDMEVALQGALGDGPGVVVISGTGSIAYGRDASGQVARAGGWGFAISDEGSGHWIGRQAVGVSVREFDQGDTCLLKLIAKAWNVETLEQVVLKANASPQPDFAALLPVVLQTAEKNSRQSRLVLTRAGDELATLAAQVIQRLFPNAQAVPVAMSGGVFANSPLVRQVFYNDLHSEFPGVVINPEVIEPVLGALDLARKGIRR